MGSIGRDTRSIRGMIPGSCKPAHVTHVELVGLSTRLLDTVEDELNPNGHTLRVECGRDEPRAVAADQPPLARSDGGVVPVRRGALARVHALARVVQRHVGQNELF